MEITKQQHDQIVSLAHCEGASLSMQTGGMLFSTATSPGLILLVESGSIRLIDHQKTFGTNTLRISEAPCLIGLGSLIDLPFAEEIRALQPCRYRLIEVSSTSDQLAELITSILKRAIDTYEYSFLFAELNRKGLNPQTRPASLSDWQTYCRLWTPSQATTSGQLIYLDEPLNGFAYGQEITIQVLDTFFSSGKPPRVAEINHAQVALAQDQQSFPFASRLQEPLDINSFPLIPELDTDSRASSEDGFKIVRGSDRRGVFAAVITMLVEHFQLPTRRDTINRAAGFLDHDKIQWRLRLLSILDELGLAVRLVRVQPDRPFRLPTPSVWISSEGACRVITSVSSNRLISIDPRQGRQKLDYEAAQALFLEQSEIISVDVGLHTPRKRFGVFWLFPYLKRYRLQLIEVFSASFLNQLFALATPLLFQQIIDRVISKGAFDALGPLVILMLIFVVLETVFSSLRTFQFVEVSNRIDVGVGSAIISRLLRINARFFDKRPVGELASRLGELENIRRFLTGTALTVVLDALFSLLYFGVMFFYSPLLTFTVLLTLPFLFAVTLGVTPVTQRLIRRRAEAASRTQSLLVEILGGIQTVKLQNAELTARRQWEDRHLDSINQGFKAVLANTTSSNALQLISKISNILIIGIGAWLVLRNELTLGQLIAFRIISGYVTQPMLRLASTWQSFQELSLSLERVGDVVNQPLEIDENEDSNIVMPELKGDISAVSLSYSYSTAAPPILSSVSLDIKAGSFVGLVGQSGCGKSTLLKMVPRLYRPTSGKLLIDQYDIAKVDLYSLRAQIGFVPQDCLLFEGTVYSNIALGDPQAESERVVRMSSIACAHEFIMELPYGYSTPVGEKGSGLSGGQRQRIALARMLLENPRLIVLDEATSALDVDTERQVVANLRAHLSGRTLLMITHRLSTLVEADQIIVMHAGRVDECGTHQQLMGQRGRYYALYQSQFGEQ